MSTAIDEGTRTTAALPSERATAVWLLAVLSTLPWIVALLHLGALPAEAARQDLADGRMWPGLLAALIIGGIAVGATVIGSWVLARRAPHLVAGVLLALALVMGWVVRPLGWRHAPVDVFIIERGKIWIVWLALSVLGTGIVAVAGLLARRSARMRAT
jgi:hypothetical protein